MGYLIGNYIHLTAENYEIYGTNEWGDKSGQKITSSIFNTHLDNIYDIAKKFSVPNLKQIETSYNKLNQEQYQQFIKILNSKNIDEYFKQNLKKELIRRMSPKETPWSEELIQDIAANLHWDSSRQTFFYTGTKAQKNSNKKVYLSSLGSADSFRYINTIMTRSQKMMSEIAAHPELSMDLKKQYMQQIKDRVIDPLKAADTYQKRTKKELAKLSKKAHKWLGVIDLKLANQYYQELLGIQQNINGIDDLNTYLQWKLSEFLGNTIAQGAAITGYQSIIDAISTVVSKGSGSSIKNTSGVALTSRIKVDFLTDKKNEKITLSENGNYVDSKGINQVAYFFKGMGDGRQQKADVEFTFDPSTKQKVGISLKNTDLSSYINKQSKDLTSDFISLQQRSSLMLYLAGIQQQQKDMANHYLNIFAKHENNELIDSEIRNAAIKSFQTALLFSALTGANQLREGGQANILAIYDKTEINGIKQVKFFDTYDLVQNGLKGTQFSPSIEKLWLSNDKETDENLSKRENASVRITKVLAEAKNKQISVYLSKNYLMSIYS